MWGELSTYSKFCLICIIAYGLLYLQKLWVDNLVQQAYMAKVIGNQTIGQSEAISVEDVTYYLSSSFSPSEERREGVNENLFVQPSVEPETKKIAPVVAQVVQTNTPLIQHVNRSINVTLIESDGAFINGRYYLWGENVTHSPVLTERGQYIAKLHRGTSVNVRLKINGENVSVGLSK